MLPFLQLAGLTVPAGLFGLSLMMPVSIMLLVSSPSVSIWISFPATATRTPTLLLAQVKEELMGRLLNRRWRRRRRKRDRVEFWICQTGEAWLQHLDLHLKKEKTWLAHEHTLYLLLCAAEACLWCVRLVFCGASVGVFCHILRLLYQLWWIHGLHWDYVEGVQILKTETHTQLRMWWGIIML